MQYAVLQFWNSFLTRENTREKMPRASGPAADPPFVFVVF